MDTRLRDICNLLMSFREHCQCSVHKSNASDFAKALEQLEQTVAGLSETADVHHTCSALNSIAA